MPSLISSAMAEVPSLNFQPIVKVSFQKVSLPVSLVLPLAFHSPTYSPTFWRAAFSVSSFLSAAPAGTATRIAHADRVRAANRLRRMVFSGGVSER